MIHPSAPSNGVLCNNAMFSRAWLALWLDSGYAMPCVELALHPQHETSRDSETQTKEDFKCKSWKRHGKFVNGSME